MKTTEQILEWIKTKGEEAREEWRNNNPGDSNGYRAAGAFTVLNELEQFILEEQ
jgi:hypothetical protein